MECLITKSKNMELTNKTYQETLYRLLLPCLAKMTPMKEPPEEHRDHKLVSGSYPYVFADGNLLRALSIHLKLKTSSNFYYDCWQSKYQLQ